jgi:hypothetical protein
MQVTALDEGNKKSTGFHLQILSTLGGCHHRQDDGI